MNEIPTRVERNTPVEVWSDRAKEWIPASVITWTFDIGDKVTAKIRPKPGKEWALGGGSVCEIRVYGKEALEKKIRFV